MARGRICDTGAVVPDGEDAAVVCPLKNDRDVPGFAVFDGVMHGLLRDSVEVVGDGFIGYQDGLFTLEPASDLKEVFDFG
jgi:hypothetical protein